MRLRTLLSTIAARCDAGSDVAAATTTESQWFRACSMNGALAYPMTWSKAGAIGFRCCSENN